MVKQAKGHSSGWKKSGAYTRSDCLSGSKAMSGERMPMGSGDMSSKQVVSHKPGKSYAMHHEEGRLGGDKKTFSSGIPSEAPCNIKGHG